MTANDEAAQWWVICLCAEWCGVCREWREAFNQAAAAHPQLHFAWVDVEDEADAMGEVEIETFPTLMIARERVPLFLGPVQPSGSQVSRLIASLLEAPSGTAVSTDAAGLMHRLCDGVLQKP